MKNTRFKKEWLGLSLLLLCLDLLTACASSPTAPATLPPSTALPAFTPTAAPTATSTALTATPTLNPTATAVPTPTPVPFTGKLVNDWQTAPDSDFFQRTRSLSGVAVDSKGTLYILNNYVGQILKYDSGGNLLADLSRPGQPAIPAKITAESAQNRVGHPVALALDRQDNLYVLDGFSNGIHKFEANGTYLGQFPALPPMGGAIGNLVGLAVDEAGIIYTLDSSTGKVEKFDKSGKFLGEWSNSPGLVEAGLPTGNPGYPSSIAADGKGHIYLAVSGNYRIKKFDLSGKFLLKWGSQGYADGQFGEAIGNMSFDTQGNIYVPDKLNNRVEKFDSQGHFLAKYGSLGSDKGQFNYPVAVAVDRQGQLYVADYLNERVQKLDARGNWLASFGRQDQGEGELNWPVAAGVDVAGNLYVADSNPPSVQKFDNQGRFLLRWQLPTPQDYHAGDPISIALDVTGNVYLSLFPSQHILKYDSQGHLLLEWSQAGSGPGQFNGVRGLTVDRHNQLWIADGGNYRVQKFDAQGRFLSELDFNFYKAAGYDRYKDAPVGVALDDQDQLYVLFSPFLRKFDSQGKFLLQWGDPKSSSMDGTFILASNVFVDGHDFVYVHQQGNFHGSGSRLQEFDNQGHLRFTWQSPLHLPMDPYITVVPPGQFQRFDAMTVDWAGNFYLATSTLGRVDKYLQK